MAWYGRMYMSVYVCSDYLHLDTLQKTLLDTIQDGVVLDDGEVLGLGEELLVGVDAGTKHIRCWGAHLAHLLRHLIRG